MIHDVTVIDQGYNGLNPVIFGFEKCSKSHAFGPAVRMYWLIHYVESGFGFFQIDGKTYRVHPGEMFVIPPFVETYYEADREHPWSYTWIGFTETGSLPTELEPVVYCPSGLQVFQEMKKCDNMENGRSAFLCAKLWEVFALLLDTKQGSVDYVEKALNCIHAEYMNGITVQDIADRVNLDRSYFSTLFKNKMGVSPGKYLLQYRMNIAASLMIQQGKSVSVAANSVGYGDIFNFSKMFKRYYGMSPQGYVKQKQELTKG